MKRILVAGVVLAVGASVAVAWTAASRDREYQRLVAAGEVALGTGQYGTAVEAFSGALALKPDSMLAYLKRGETYRRSGDLKAALRDLRQAAILDPASTHALEQLGDVQTALGHDDRAAARYDAYVAIDDRSPPVLYKLALARYRQGQTSAAQSALRRALAQDDRFAEAHYLLGLCLESRPHESITELERAVALRPGMAPARDALARAYRAAGRHDAAVDQLEALAALHPTQADRQLALALAYANGGRTDLAVTTLRRALERFPDSVAVYSALGEVWLRQAEARGDRVALEKAGEALRTAVVRGGSTSHVLALYGRSQLLKGNVAGALRTLREAVTILPVEPEALQSLATAAAAGGDVRGARNALVRYVALLAGAPPPRDLCQRIGEWSLALHDPETAARWLTRAVDPNHPDPVVLAALAEAELGAGRLEQARAAVDRGLAVAPGNPRLLRLRSRMQSS